MVHHVYRETKGCLVRFSLLPSGAVKKAQVLGGKLRLMAFEWTHLACPQSVYERMVESMRVKLPMAIDEEEMRLKIIGKYGGWGKSGWVNRGDSVESLVKIYGQPQEENQTQMKWVMREGDYMYHLVAVIKDGKFLYFLGDGLESAGAAIEDTVSWVEEQLEGDDDGNDDPFGDGGDGGKENHQAEAKPLDRNRMMKVMVQSASDASMSRSQYQKWLDVASSLIDKEFEKKPLVDVFVKAPRGEWYEVDFLEHLSAGQKKKWYGLVLKKM